jgi:hypothetical protein
MTRSAPELALRHPVMTPVLLWGTAALAADPIPTRTVRAVAVIAANLCLLRLINNPLSPHFWLAMNQVNPSGKES